MSKINDLIKKLCPNGVRYKKLNEVFDLFSGMTGVSNKWASEGNCQFIDYMNAYKNNKIDVNQLQYATVKNINQTALIQGDLLLTSASETPDECAISSVIEDEIKENIFMDDHLFGLRLKSEYKNIINTTFVNYYLNSKPFRCNLFKAVRGVTRFYISNNDYMKLTIPIPPLEVQEEIVRILDKFGELEVELEVELEARKSQYEFWRGIILSGKLFDNFDIVQIGDIGKICMCKRVMKHETNENGGIPFYKIKSFGGIADTYISEELYNQYKQKYSYPKEGDILISASGTIGKTVIFDGKPSYFQDSNIVWVDNNETKVLNKYLYYAYSIIEWKVEGGTIKRLYNDNLKQAKIIVPSIENQKKVINILDKFDKLINDISVGLPAEIEARRKQYEYYRNKLLSFEVLDAND